jgi:uncharacterized protein (DUF2126 family)
VTLLRSDVELAVLHTANYAKTVVSKGRHPKNAINAALAVLDPAKFEVMEVHNGHRWGKVVCRACNLGLPIWSTPQVPDNEAKRIRRFSDKHQH